MAQYNAMYRTIWMPPSIPRDLVDAAIAARTARERTVVTGPITYQGQAQVQRDLDNFKDALEGLQFEEAFVPSATPSRNDADPAHVYASEQAYLYAVADAMHEEYKAIVDAGFVVQLDLGLPARNQVLPGKPAPTLGGAAARLGDAGRGVQPRAAAASPRTGSATTCAGAA